MGKMDDIHKTIAYVRRNGFGAAFFAARERLDDRKTDYTYIRPNESILGMQREMYESWQGTGQKLPMFSIIVPCYNTPEEFLRRMIKSVQAQTYPSWELIIADASSFGSGSRKNDADTNMNFADKVDISGDTGVQNKEYDTFYDPDSANNITSVGAIVSGYRADKRIRYFHLGRNYGIAENSNLALKKAEGDYVCLLDHDDIITPDALYENAAVLVSRSWDKTKGDVQKESRSDEIVMMYSDEDKCNSCMSSFFEVNEKPDFDPDYLLSNNYICHFAVFRSDIIKEIGFRSQFDGAQDYDLILRTCALDHFDSGMTPVYSAEAFFKNNDRICHIPKVLYHWRCHGKSTAGSTTAKEYAYSAGQDAIKSLLQSLDIEAEVSKLPHVGFYHCDYRKDIFNARADLGVVGGRINDRRGTLVGGIYSSDGTIMYDRLPKGFSGGFQHRAVVQQKADAVDIRCMLIRDELRPLFEEITGMSYARPFNYKIGNKEAIELSISFCTEVRKRGWNIMWDPQLKL